MKPSNVLVTLYDGKPVPKVIDFGVAKAIDQRLTERTMFTHYGSVVGTLEYMSPEQAEMSALGVDTRSDIYTLGVLLYELLTGSTPLERSTLREAGYNEILRRIKEEEPPKPSTRLNDSRERLASICSQRHTEPARLTRLVRGELDWIVMKALEKDRTRRYETASGFARDIERYLAGDPVEAGPPSATYKLRKLRASTEPQWQRPRRSRRSCCWRLRSAFCWRLQPSGRRPRHASRLTWPRKLAVRRLACGLRPIKESSEPARPNRRHGMRRRKPKSPRQRPGRCSSSSGARFWRRRAQRPGRGPGQGRDDPRGGRRGRSGDRKIVCRTAHRGGVDSRHAGPELPVPERTGAGDPPSRTCARPATAGRSAPTTLTP